MRRLAATLTLLALAQQARAEFWDGDELFRRLEIDARGDKTYEVGEASGFVIGVAAAYYKAADCPAGVHVVLTKRTVLSYLRQHPEQRHLSAAYNIGAALKAAGACDAQQPTGP